jgi:hypothetical protein
LKYGRWHDKWPGPLGQAGLALPAGGEQQEGIGQGPASAAGDGRSATTTAAATTNVAAEAHEDEGTVHFFLEK